MQIAIIQSPTAANPVELIEALQRLDFNPVVCFSTAELVSFDGYIFLAAPAQIDFLREETAQGKPMLGFAEGAEFLIHAGFVPGVEHNLPAISLESSAQLASCVRLSEGYQYNMFTRYLTKQDVLPIAKKATKSIIVPPALLAEMQENGLNVFCYVNTQESAWAAVSNKSGNVLAILPELEYTEKTSMLFKSMREALLSDLKQNTKNLNYYPRKI